MNAHEDELPQAYGSFSSAIFVRCLEIHVPLKRLKKVNSLNINICRATFTTKIKLFTFAENGRGQYGNSTTLCGGTFSSKQAYFPKN